MIRYLTLLTFLLVFDLSCHAEASEVLQRLDDALSSASKFDAEKKTQIKHLHDIASSARSENDRYKAYIELYEAYESYKYDSASVYADKAMSLARHIGNADFMVEAACAKVFCLLSAGLYKEAFDEVGQVDISNASSPYLYKYYFVKWRLLADISDYSRAEPYMSQYIRQSRILVDTLRHYMRPKSTQWNYIIGMQLMKERKCRESESYFQKVLSDKHISMHERAISTSCLGYLYKLRGDTVKALRYLAEAAICDIKSSTKETTALRQVGALLFAQGDVEHAINYVQKALDDANFYNARQRKIEIGGVLPVIEQSRYKDMRAQRNVMILCIVMAFALLGVSAVSSLFIKKQMRKLKLATRIIQERNQKLEQANAQLSEANKIKTEYIGKSFYQSAGYLYKLRGDTVKALRYLAEAAICDIKSSTKETTALRQVGALLFAQGDVEHAINYVQKALDDANFYNARQRKIEIGGVLPVIEQSRYKDMRAQRNVMILCIVMAFALLGVSAVSSLFIKKQMRKLKLATRIIQERNQKLEQANAQLSEANKIKTEYIGKSFYQSAGYFEKIEKLYRLVDRKLSARQYDDLRRTLSERSLMEERKDMYADFDETFLRLFPSFIEKYNKLFNEKDRKNPSDTMALSNEMRIFALIRLGITDSERIALFLNYSVNTINTYKTRVKNKSLVNNDEFEQHIMAI